MSEFLVEAYFPPNDPDSGPRVEDVADAAERMTSRGRSVRLLRSVVLPADETCLYLFEAESITDVVETANRAGLRIERSCEALSAWAPGPAADGGLVGSRSADSATSAASEEA